ncbi:hypothetical protein Tco_1332107 [Tanacetum coccineum]
MSRIVPTLVVNKIGNNFFSMHKDSKETPSFQNQKALTISPVNPAPPIWLLRLVTLGELDFVNELGYTEPVKLKDFWRSDNTQTPSSQMLCGDSYSKLMIDHAELLWEEFT